MRSFTTLIFISAFTVTINAQNFWERTEPYYTSFNKLYFGGGDTIYGTLGSGFSRSTNNGSTWSAPVVVNYVTDISVAPNGYIFLSENQQRMSRSTNKGATWVVKGTGIIEPSCSCVMVSSTGTIVAGTNAGIYRSTNNGDNWTKVAGSVQLGPDTSISTMATYDGNMLYAFTRLNASIDKCFAIRSTDDGVTWTKSASSVDTATIYKAVIHQNGNIFTRTGSGVRYSTDGGNSWKTIGFQNKFISDVATDQSGAVYASVNYKDTNAVLYKTTNNGTVWTPITTPFNGISGIGINKNGHIFLSQDQLYRSIDNGSSWNALPVGFPEVKYMSESPKHELFFTAGGSAYQHLYRSSDFGLSWHIQYTGVVGIPIVGFYGDTLFVGDNYYLTTVYRSTDNGKTFTSVPNNTGLSGYAATILGTSFQSILIGSSNGIYRSKDHGKNWNKVLTGSISSVKQFSNGTLYALREVINDGIYRSVDSGSTWQQKISGMANVIARSFAIAPNGNLFCGTDGGVFRSTNDGDVWLRIDTQKVNKPSGQYITVNRDGKIFVGGTPGGSTNSIYQSADNGISWTLLPNDIFSIDSQSKVRQLFASSNGSLFAGSTVGLFRSKNITTNTRYNTGTIPNKFSLVQNYPNPFNPTTVINYQLPMTSHISLKVYDAIGREVATLVNEVKEAGSYSVTFNASTLSGGLYIARLQNGAKTESKKMLLIK